MNFHDLSRFVAEGLVNTLIVGTAIACVAWLLARGLVRHGSGTRFAVWFLALIVTALVPWAGSVATASSRTAPALASGALTLPESFAYSLASVWIIGAVLGLAHVAHGLYRLQRLRAACIPIDENQLDPALRMSLADAQAHRRVTLCTSDAVRVPAAIGYFRPLVVFPAWALAEIPAQELNAVLLHELAHLRRYDDWTNLAQKILKAIFFFHPAVWFIDARLTLEREMACDDAVLAASFSPRAYAESLVGLAEKSFLRRGIQLAQAAVGHAQQLKLRLAEILRQDRTRQGSAGLRKPAIALLSLAAIMTTYGIDHAPRLIAFAGDPPQVASTSAAAHAIVPESNSHLQPVNLNYKARTGSAALAVRHAEFAITRNPHRAPSRPRVVLAIRTGEPRRTNPDAPPPMLVLSNFPAELPAPVLVVFQGEQFGANGPIVWRVTVIHLTPVHQRMLIGGVSQQI